MAVVKVITHAPHLAPKSALASSSPPVARPVPPPLAEPTPLELASNFAGALSRWIAAGLPVVDRETYDVRASACAACEHWEPAARGGLGKCSAPGCGCTSLKRWLATERCPLGKWSR